MVRYKFSNGVVMDIGKIEFTQSATTYTTEVVQKAGKRKQRLFIDAITDYGPKVDLNNDKKLDEDEVELIFRAMDKNGKVDEKKLNQNIKNYEEKQNNTPNRNIIRFPNSNDVIIIDRDNDGSETITTYQDGTITIKNFDKNLAETNSTTLPASKENIDKYLKGIALNF